MTETINQSHRNTIKITAIKLRQLKVLGEAGTVEPARDPGRQMRITIGGGSIVEIQTDQGLVGIGPGFDPQLLPAVERCLMGQDPFDLERHLGVLRYYSRWTLPRQRRRRHCPVRFGGQSLWSAPLQIMGRRQC